MSYLIFLRLSCEGQTVTSRLFLADKMFCPNCHKLYKNITTLAAHLRQDCKRGLDFQCHLCPYKTRRKHNLKQHIRNRHSALVPETPVPF
jgi:hypothetical protein